MRRLVRDFIWGFEWLEILGFSTESKQIGEGVKNAQKCDYVIHGWSLYICTHHRHHIRDHKRLYESSPRSSGAWWSGTIILLVAPPPFRKSKPKKIGILLPKLFWPAVRKKCSNDREKLLELNRGWRARIRKNLRSLGQFIQTINGQYNFWNRMLFNLFLFFSQD